MGALETQLSVTFSVISQLSAKMLANFSAFSEFYQSMQPMHPHLRIQSMKCSNQDQILSR